MYGMASRINSRWYVSTSASFFEVIRPAETWHSGGDDLEASDRWDGVGTAYLAVPRTSMRPIRIALTTASSFE